MALHGLHRFIRDRDHQRNSSPPPNAPTAPRAMLAGTGPAADSNPVTFANPQQMPGADNMSHQAGRGVPAQPVHTDSRSTQATDQGSNPSQPVQYGASGLQYEQQNPVMPRSSVPTRGPAYFQQPLQVNAPGSAGPRILTPAQPRHQPQAYYAQPHQGQQYLEQVHQAQLLQTQLHQARQLQAQLNQGPRYDPRLLEAQYRQAQYHLAEYYQAYKYLYDCHTQQQQAFQQQTQPCRHRGQWYGPRFSVPVGYQPVAAVQAQQGSNEDPFYCPPNSYVAPPGQVALGPSLSIPREQAGSEIFGEQGESSRGARRQGHAETRQSYPGIGHAWISTNQQGPGEGQPQVNGGQGAPESAAPPTFAPTWPPPWKTSVIMISAAGPLNLDLSGIWSYSDHQGSSSESETSELTDATITEHLALTAVGSLNDKVPKKYRREHETPCAQSSHAASRLRHDAIPFPECLAAGMESVLDSPESRPSSPRSEEDTPCPSPGQRSGMKEGHQPHGQSNVSNGFLSLMVWMNNFRAEQAAKGKEKAAAAESEQQAEQSGSGERGHEANTGHAFDHGKEAARDHGSGRDDCSNSAELPSPCTSPRSWLNDPEGDHCIPFFNDNRVRYPRWPAVQHNPVCYGRVPTVNGAETISSVPSKSPEPVPEAQASETVRPRHRSVRFADPPHLSPVTSRAANPTTPRVRELETVVEGVESEFPQRRGYSAGERSVRRIRHRRRGRR